MLLKSTILALTLGYILCVIAKKQEGILKSLGYTLGIATMVLAVLYALMLSATSCSMMCGKSCMMQGGMMKGGHHQMMKR